MKRNYNALRMALNDLALEYAASKVAPDMTAIEDAIGAYAALHPNTIYRVKKSGYDIVFLANNWDDADDPAKPALIDNMSASLDADYQLTQVVMTGSNLSQAIKMRLAGALLDGSIVISLGGQRAVFTPATPVVVVGDKTLDAMIGSVVKKSIVISGDQRDYFNLSLLVSPSRGGQVTGAGRYVSGTVVPISAVPAAGYRFKQWSDGNTNANRNITVNADSTLTAVFETINVSVEFNFAPGILSNIQVGAQNYPVGEEDDYCDVDIEKGTHPQVTVTMAAGSTFGGMTISRNQTVGSGFGNDPEDLTDTTSNNPETLYIAENQVAGMEITISAE